VSKAQKENNTFDLYQEAPKKRKVKKTNRRSDEMIEPKVKIITHLRKQLIQRLEVLIVIIFFRIKDSVKEIFTFRKKSKSKFKHILRTVQYKRRDINNKLFSETQKYDKSLTCKC